MPFPDDGPAYWEQVKSALGIADDDTSDDEQLQELTDAVNVVVRTWPVVEDLGDLDELDDWPSNVTLGADLLVAQCWRVKGSPGGTAPSTAADPVFVAYGDPTVVMLLRLNQPAVG